MACLTVWASITFLHSITFLLVKMLKDIFILILFYNIITFILLIVFVFSKVNKNFAIKLVAEEPVSEVGHRVVSCDGGGGALGHPKVYINLVWRRSSQHVDAMQCFAQESMTTFASINYSWSIKGVFFLCKNVLEKHLLAEWKHISVGVNVALKLCRYQAWILLSKSSHKASKAGFCNLSIVALWGKKSKIRGPNF